jgi:hypothetical protein
MNPAHHVFPAQRTWCNYIAALTYIAGGRRPEFRFTLVVSFALAALFAFLPFIPAFQHDIGLHGKKVLL